MSTRRSRINERILNDRTINDLLIESNENDAALLSKKTSLCNDESSLSSTTTSPSSSDAEEESTPLPRMVRGASSRLLPISFATTATFISRGDKKRPHNDDEEVNMAGDDEDEQYTSTTPPPPKRPSPNLLQASDEIPPPSSQEELHSHSQESPVQQRGIGKQRRRRRGKAISLPMPTPTLNVTQWFVHPADVSLLLPHCSDQMTAPSSAATHGTFKLSVTDPMTQHYRIHPRILEDNMLLQQAAANSPSLWMGPQHVRFTDFYLHNAHWNGNAHVRVILAGTTLNGDGSIKYMTEHRANMNALVGDTINTTTGRRKPCRTFLSFQLEHWSAVILPDITSPENSSAESSPSSSQ